MKHGQGMLTDRRINHRTESLFVRCLYPILIYATQLLWRARASQSANVQKERYMDEIPTDDEVLDALRASEDGLTPTALLQALGAEHTAENIIRAIQRVLDRNKV